MTKLTNFQLLRYAIAAIMLGILTYLAVDTLTSNSVEEVVPQDTITVVMDSVNCN